MKKLLFTLVFTIVCIWGGKAEPDPNFHIYLAFGQSNMQGMDYAIEEVRIPHPRYKMLVNADCDDLNRKRGEWVSAVANIGSCNDNIMGLSETFGRVLADSLPCVTVGIVHVAIGGASIMAFNEDTYEEAIKKFNQWQISDAKKIEPNGNLYRALVDLAQIAQKDGVIKGIIMHQGEADNGPEWKYRVKTVRDKLLNDLGLSADSVPFVAGEMVRTTSKSRRDRIIQVDSLPYIMENTYVVSSLGCEGKSDSLHFSSAGYTELGKRYAHTMLQHINYDRNNVINHSCAIENLAVSPNPTYGILYVDMPQDGSAEVYSLTGMKMKECKLNAGRDIIDISNCPMGMYVIVLRSGDDVSINKVVKK